MEILFQFTHPRGVRFVRYRHHSKHRGFNSRTREGCDFLRHVLAGRFDVSIHAPARGAITPWGRSGHGTSFNSRTREGCDFLVAAMLTGTEFQFTHPRGVRFHRGLGFLRLLVSIHAPARGAIGIPQRIRPGRCFNSRTREGCDNKELTGVDGNKFQFTHPRGVRFASRARGGVLRRFNSRTREGCDSLMSLGVLHSEVSIHAPARGAIWSCLPSLTWIRFNSRTREGCDARTHYGAWRLRVSIHAPARGAMKPTTKRTISNGFNSRTREGCDSAV